MAGKGNKPFMNGVILSVVGAYLAVYFTLKGLWNVGSVFALVLVAALAAFQFVIHAKFFKNTPKR